MRIRIKNKIKNYRLLKGLNQAQLADKLGISRVYLSEVENGRVPGGDVVLKLSILFNEDARNIFFTEDVVYSLQN